MNHGVWETVHRIFEKMKELLGERGDMTSPGLSQGAVSEGLEENLPGARRTLLTLEDMVRVRAEIRTQLDVFRAALAEYLAERDCYLVLFPIVAHFDELVQTRYLDPDQLSWPMLQSELFQIDDAGEVFYDTLDDILLKPQTLPFIFEVFYLCLSHGFRGRYVTNPAKIKEYMERLRGKIPVKDARDIPLESEETVLIEETGSPIWYYVAATGIVVLVYFMLSASARLWHPLM